MVKMNHRRGICRKRRYSNLILIKYDANLIDDLFDHEIDKIYLNFSDPWPKKRHTKRRLTSSRFLEKYDLILLDEEMPYMNGEEVLKKLKEIKGFNTKVLLLTKNNNIEYTEEYKENNFDDYILKPIDKNTLIEKINILVNDKKYE